ncbi:MAG: ester cyclase [Egibacteraceae bacterium]
MPTPEENKAVIRRYLEEAWNRGDWTVAEEVVAEDAVFHDQVREGELPPGREGVRVAMERVRTGMPDMTMDIHEVVAEGDMVVVRWSATATQAGPFNGIPPTDRVATLHAISMVRMKDGRIVEGWQEADRMGLAQQLGLMPKGQMPRPVAGALAFGIRCKDRLARRRRR